MFGLCVQCPGPSKVALVVSNGRSVTSPIAVALAQSSLGGGGTVTSLTMFSTPQPTSVEL